MLADGGIAPAPSAPHPGRTTQLMYACSQGDLSTVQKILQQHPPSVHHLDRIHRSVLHYCAGGSTLPTYPKHAQPAARLSHCADLVVMAAPDLVHSRDQDGFTPLHLAVIAGNVQLVQFLLAHGADVQAKDGEMHSVVHWAAVCGETAALQAVIAAGASVSSPDVHGGYPIHYAAQMCGSEKPDLGLQVLHILLSAGASVSVVDNDGRHPLLWAASAGSARAVLALVRAGAAVEAADKDGLTALHCAASRGHTDTLDTLLTLCGAQPDVIDSNGCTALHYSVTLGHADATALLLSHSADPNLQDRKGRSAAHCGCAKGQLETVRQLHAAGANLWLRTARGDLPLHEAAASGRRQLVKWLLDQRPSQVNARNNDGRGLLHLAALNDNADLCKILLDSGIAVNPLLRTSKNVFMTPLDCALQRGFRSTAKFLQLHGGVPANKLNVLRLTSEVTSNISSTSQLHIREDVTVLNGSSSESDVDDRQSSKSRKKTIRRKLSYKHERKRSISEDKSKSKEARSNLDLKSDGKQFRKKKTEAEESKSEIETSPETKMKRKTQNNLDALKKKDSSIETSDKDKKDNLEQSKKKSDDETINNQHKLVQKSISKHSSQEKSIEEVKQLPDKLLTEPEAQENVTTIPQDTPDTSKPPILESQTSIKEDEQKSTTADAKMSSEEVKSSEESAQVEEPETPKLDELEQPELQPDQISLQSKLSEEESKTIVVEAAVHHPPKGISQDVSEEHTTQEDTQETGETVKDAFQSQGTKEDLEDIPVESESVQQEPDKDTELEEAKQESKLEESETKNEKSESLESAKEEQDTDVKLEEPAKDVKSEETEKVEVQPEEDNNQEETKIQESSSKLEEEKLETEEGKEQKIVLEKKTSQELSETKLEDSTAAATEVGMENKEIDAELPPEESSTTIELPEESSTTETTHQETEKTESSEVTVIENTEAEEPKKELNIDLSLKKFEESARDHENSEEEHEIKDKREKSKDNEQEDSSSREATSSESEDDHKLPETLEKNHKSFKILDDVAFQVLQESPVKRKKSKKRKEIQESATSSPEMLESARNRSKSLPRNRNSLILPSIQKRPESNLSAPNLSSIYSDNEHKSESEVDDISSASRKKKMKRKKRVGSKSAGSDYESSNLIDSGFEPSPRSSRIPKRKVMSERGVNMTSVTQQIQSNIRRYHMERKIFQHLLDLKRLQIRSGQSNEHVLVKRAIENYHNSVASSVGAGRYMKKDFTYRGFEQFLYQSLRMVQGDAADHLKGLPIQVDNPLLCTQSTHRCLHATHAYTGIPCTAYLPKMNHHTMPKIGFTPRNSSFLPQISSKGKSVTLELCHGNDKQVISLPADRLDHNKRYYVTFTVKGQDGPTENTTSHRHAKSV